MDDTTSCAGAAQSGSRLWVVPDLIRLFATFLDPAEVACTLRLVNKTTAAVLHGPQHTTLRLSVPCPHHAFAQRWCSPHGLRSLSRWRKRHLLRLTARSGCLDNLEALLPLVLADDPGALDSNLFEGAATGGSLEACMLLHKRGCPNSVSNGRCTSLLAAARAGHMHICTWLLNEAVCPWDHNLPSAAARGGQEEALEWAMSRPESREDISLTKLLEGAAEGCELAVLQRLHGEWARAPEDPYFHTRYMMAAVRSGTADWQSKLEWLHQLQRPPRHYAIGLGCAVAGVRQPGGAVARLMWLRERGYPLSDEVARVAAKEGNAEVLIFLLREGLSRPCDVLLDYAAESGCLGCLKALHAHGCDMFPEKKALLRVVGGPAHLTWKAEHVDRVAAAEWLVETLGVDVVEVGVEAMEAAAARADSQEVLSWLVERGCGWSAACFTAAAEAGASEEQLEWMVERGCLMPDDGGPYVPAAHTNNLGMLRCLRRLNCPWTSSTYSKAECDERRGAEAATLRCLAEELGCPVGWRSGMAVAVVRRMVQAGVPWSEEMGVLKSVTGMVARLRGLLRG